MKDTFHYTQEGYNAVGEDAGKNMAYYVNTGMEPYFYDSEYGCFYPFGGSSAPDTDEDMGSGEPPAASENVVVSVAGKTHDFSKVGAVSGDKVTVTAKSASDKVILTETAVLSDDYSWTVEMVIGNMVSGTTVLASVGGSEATGFITVPNTVPSKAGDTAQFRFRDLGRSCPVDFTMPADFDPAAKHHLAITYDAATNTFKAYLDKQELAVKYTVGSQAKGFNDTPISCLIGGYKTTEYNFRGDFYYFAFHRKVLTTVNVRNPHTNKM